MPLKLESSPARGSLTRRIAVTLAALFVYRLGAAIPLPGLDAKALADQAAAGTLLPLARLSLMALGIAPLLFTIVLAELAMIAWPKLRVWFRQGARGRDLWTWLILCALLMAAFQANGIAIALEAVSSRLVPEPGLAFRAGVVGSLVAATAVLIWLATLITRHGLGFGIWILVAVPHVMDLVPAVWVQASREPERALAGLVALGYLALTIAVLVALTRCQPKLAESEEAAWAPLLGVEAINLLLMAVLVMSWLFSTDPHAALPDFLFSETGLSVVLLVSLMLVVLLRRRSLMQADPAFPIQSSAVPLALALGGLAVVRAVAEQVVAQPLFPTSGTVFILAAVGLMIVDELERSKREMAAETPPHSK